MTQHTPGPWEQSRMRLPTHVKDRRCGFVVNGPDNTEELPIRVCDLRVPQGITGFSEGQANARLIAASPTMLKALQNLVKCVKDNTDAWEADGSELNTKQHGLAVCLNTRAGDLINEAIAAATTSADD